MFWTLIGYAALVVLGVCAIAVIGAILIPHFAQAQANWAERYREDEVLGGDI